MIFFLPLLTDIKFVAADKLLAGDIRQSAGSVISHPGGQVSGKETSETTESLFLPFVIDRLYDEAQGWTHSVDIFFHDMLDNRCLPRVV